MPKMQSFQYQSGRLQPFPLQADTYDEALLKVSRGPYTVFRIYPKNRVLRFQAQIERLRRSASILGMPFLFHSNEIRQGVSLAVTSSGIRLPRICLLIPIPDPDTILLMLQDFSPPTEDEFKEGVRVALAPLKREKPSAKDSGFIRTRSILRQQHPQSREILMYDEAGRILEGLSSNFFAISQDELRTASDGVLEGISRRILLEVASSVLPVLLDPIHIHDLKDIQEAFLTSTSRGVLPVTRAGDIPIGSGRPGPVTKNLHSLFDAQVDSELEPILYE